MKKILATILALTMVLSLGAMAFADGAIDTDADAASGSESQEVKVAVTKEVKNDKYKVEIEWTTLEFTYNLGTKTWSTTDHEWSAAAGAGWSAGEPNGTITLKNHSSKPVDIALAFAGETGEVGGVSGWNAATCTFSQGTGDGGKYEGGTAKLKTADSNPGSTGEEQELQVQFNFSSLPTPTEEVSTAAKFGTITATVQPGTYSD